MLRLLLLLVGTCCCVCRLFDCLIVKVMMMTLCCKDVEIKHQGHSSSYAFVQFDNIVSVVAALHEMDGELLGSNKIKVREPRQILRHNVIICDIVFVKKHLYYNFGSWIGFNNCFAHAFTDKLRKKLE